MTDGAPLSITAYIVGPTDGWLIEPASPRRAWMDDTGGFAYRCLPLTIANQAGWVVRCPAPFQAVWNGGPATTDTAVLVTPGYERFSNQILSHFGWGIVTFSLPWLFRTPDGYTLHVRGPVNEPRHAIAALEGVVETDWAASTFTMNWKLTEADRIVRFAKGDPICHLSLVRVADLERSEPGIEYLDANPDLKADYQAWSASRNSFNKDPNRAPGDWQKDYFRGETVSGERAREHRSRLKIKPFPGQKTEG